MTQEKLGQLLKKLGEPDLNAKECLGLYQEYIAQNGSYEKTTTDGNGQADILVKMLEENWELLTKEVSSGDSDALVLFLLKVGVLFEVASPEVQKNFRLSEKSKSISQRTFRLTIQYAISNGIYRHQSIGSRSQSFWHLLIDNLKS